MNKKKLKKMKKEVKHLRNYLKGMDKNWEADYPGAEKIGFEILRGYIAMYDLDRILGKKKKSIKENEEITNK